MTKNLTDLNKELAEKLEEIDSKTVERVTDGFIELLKTSMFSGEVMIREFGKFFTTERAAKSARNPHTGEKIDVPARLVPRCKFSKAFSRDVKDGNIGDDSVTGSEEIEWYVAIADKAKGPLNEGQVKKMLKTGKISNDTLVYNSYLGENWKPLSETELMPVSPTPPIPPVPSVSSIPPIPKTA